MLAALAIRDIVLIERLDLTFSAGLTVLTGETGAGKSILLDALSLALGARGDGALVRHGAVQGQVTAVFEPAPDHPAWRLLAENGLDASDGLILRRTQSVDGRSRAFINDQPVGVSLLRQVGAALVEIHGQHDDRALVDTAIHRVLLDAFGGLGADRLAVAEAYAAWRQAEAELAEQRRAVAAAESEAGYLRDSVAELRALAPVAGEEDVLADRRQAMMRSEKIATDISEALEVVSGTASPVPSLASLARRLERKRDTAGGLLDPAIDAIDRALAALDEAAVSLETAMRDSAFDPRELERTEGRLFALRAAARKYDAAVDQLPELIERMDAALTAYDTGAARIGALAETARQARAGYDALAAALSAARREAAADLNRAVAVELPSLRLERAEFTATISTDAANPGETGIDAVEFVVRTNPGSRPGPLTKVASGGELSRFLLALKVALADRGSAPTLVFDEIDTAVGGAVADAIGVRLARLAQRVQVVTVTHAPQVAARAETHLLIAKQDHGSEQRVVTQVTPLDPARRREEIARMLAGSVVTDEARAAAGTLIAGATADRIRETT